MFDSYTIIFDGFTLDGYDITLDGYGFNIGGCSFVLLIHGYGFTLDGYGFDGFILDGYGFTWEQRCLETAILPLDGKTRGHEVKIPVYFKSQSILLKTCIFLVVTFFLVPFFSSSDLQQ